MQITIFNMLRNNLRKIRKNIKISSEEIARRAGISYSTYNKIETGKANPRLETALRISKVLKVAVETLFKLEEE